MSNKTRIILLLVVVAAVFSFVSLNYQNVFNKNSGKISVVTTLFPYYDFARIIGGDKAEVSLLLPPGVEAHSFEPKPSDIFKMNGADIFVYTGDFMEAWAEDILKGIDNKNLAVVKAGDGIALIPGAFHDDDEPAGSMDPHIWLDLSNSEDIADGIASAFVRKDPQNSDFYIENVHELKNELKDLDNSFKIGLSNCQSKTVVYGGHYAFGYLVKRYELNYLAAQGLAPDSEPTARDLARLINELKKNDIKYVFYEELSSPKIAETISGEAGAEMLLLNAAHNITKEDMDKGVSFTDIMKEDLVNLKIGLECR